MKKIVYILAATLLSSSAAFAVAPRVKAVNSATDKAERTTISRNNEMNRLNADLSKKAPVMKSLANGAISSSLNDETTVDDQNDVKALYAPTGGAFYLGLTPNFGLYRAFYGFTGIKNLVGFANTSSNAETFEWTYGYAVDYDEDTQTTIYDDKTDTDVNLFMELEPMAEYQAPILAANKGANTDTYQAAIDGYCTGRAPAYWGFAEADPETGEFPYETYPGVSNYGYKITGLQATYAFSYNTVDKENYNDNGLSDDWDSYFGGNENVQYSNWKVKAAAAYVPAKPSSYLLEDVYGRFSISTTEDITLTCNVYFVPTEEGQEMGAPVASGQLSIPAGDFPSEDADMPSFTLFALDDDGYETDMPLAVPALQPLYITIEGFTHPAVTDFIMPTIKGYACPMDDFNWTLYNAMSPTHAYFVMDVDVLRAGETEPTTLTYDCESPSAYYSDATRTAVYYPTDFALFYHVFFPIVANLDSDSEDYGTANFEVNVPAEGGSAIVKVASDFSIAELLDEGIMKTAATGAWMQYQVAEVESEDGAYTQISIDVEALPEGETGRQGAIVFDGYASDFYIIVNQGDASGISNVAAVNGPVEYFDLQGRKLNAAPANGIYLQRQGNKTTKCIAK